MGCASSYLSNSEDQEPYITIDKSVDEINQNYLQENSRENSKIVLCQNPELSYIPTLVLRNNNGTLFKGQLGYQEVAVHQIYPHKQQDMQHEIGLLSGLDHENVIRYFFEYRNAEILYVVTEYFENTIRDYVAIPSSHKHLKMQILNAVAYMQACGIVIVNLTPGNIFVVERNSKQTVKLTDFSCAIQIKNESCKITGYGPTSKDFSAPEVHISKHAHKSSDLYSLGCIFYFLFANGATLNKLKYKGFSGIISGKKSFATSNDYLCADLICKLVKQSPIDRLPIGMIREHPFFWNDDQTTAFIVDIQIEIESGDSDFRKCLYTNSHLVVGFNEDWTSRIEENVLKELELINKDFKARNRAKSPSNKPEKKENIISLIRIMRNISVHKNTGEIAALMGTTALFLNYWLTKFPNLIMHLYNAKLNYENGNF